MVGDAWTGGTAHHYIVRDRIVLERIPLERIIFFEDMRFDFIIFERIGAIMPDPEERDMPDEPLIEPPI
jgi:hypothetical protein